MEKLASESQHQWTSEEIRKRLGASTIPFPVTTSIGAREISMIREAGIVRVEICGFYPSSHYDHRNRTQVSEIIAECQKQDIAIVSVHGPTVSYNSEYEGVRKAVVKEAIMAARVAEEMGASIFVAHFGKDEHSVKTVSEMLNQFNDSPLKLVVENLPGEDLREFMRFVDKIGSDQFGMAVDIGHTRDPDGINPFTKKGSARQMMAQCGERVFHVHLHDFRDRDHMPPFDGNIQWGEIFAAFKDMAYKGEFLFEAQVGTPEEVLQKTAAFPETFIRRYGNR